MSNAQVRPRWFVARHLDGCWSLLAAALAWVGLLHSYQWTVGDTALQLGWGVGSQFLSPLDEKPLVQ